MEKRFHNTIAARLLSPRDEALKIAQNGNISIYYSPFDYICTTARIAIVGITPGAQQASNALITAHEALKQGASREEALRQAKDHASFSGAMRSHLVSMLDDVGIAQWLGIPTTASLWGENAHLAHFTSVLRYPVFVNGQNYSGSSPNMLTHPLLRQQIEAHFAQEMSRLPTILWIPLGEKVTRVLATIGARQRLSPQILAGLPHPSPANIERISYFLGKKAAEELSVRTNAGKLDTARQHVLTTMRSLPAT
jgi:hypothetical protein